MPNSVTVIIPVYNAEKYICRCVDSVLAQTYADFELLLINDGSKDKSGDICEEYATLDSRIRVFHKKNEGASSARNYGLDRAKGKYICFIDADDWVEKDYLQQLMPSADEDLVVCSIRYEEPEQWLLPLWHKDYDSTDLCNSLDYIVEHMAVCSPCCKIIRSEVIEKNNIRFDTKVCAGEDMLFVYDYMLMGVNSMRTISMPLYHYNMVESSLSHRVVPAETTFYVMDALNEKLNRIGEKFCWDCSHALKGMLCTQFFNLLAYVKQQRGVVKKVKLLYKISRNKNIKILFHDKNYLIHRRQYGKLRRMMLGVILFLYKILF